MKVLLAVCGIFLAISTPYVSAQSLQVEVNGEITSDTQFCLNQTLTFVCTVQESTFQWIVGSLLTGNDGRVSVGTAGAVNTETVGMFTLTAEGASAPNFRSTLTVTASAGLNGIMITCAGNLMPNNNQATEVSIYGDPSAPNISNIFSRIIGDVVVFDLVVDPPVESTQCVTSYVMTINGVYTVEVSLEQRPPETQTITVNTADVVGTKPCNTSNNFMVRANNSNQESEVVEGFFDYNAGSFRFGNNVAENTIVISVPQILQGCILGYEHTYLNNTGAYNESADMIPLDLFPNNTDCFGQDCRVTLTPIIFLEMTILTNSQFEVYLNNDTSPTPSTLPVAIIAGVVGCVVGLVLILLLVVIGLIIYKISCVKSKIGIERLVEPDTSVPVDNHEALPTYQDPASIKRETTGQSGDVYTLPQKKPQKESVKNTHNEELPVYSVVDKSAKQQEGDPASIKRETTGQSGDVYTVPQKKPKKGSVKSTQNEELPMYSVVDKSAKQQEGLVYAGMNVKSPVKSCSRPPAPPGVTEHEPMEPVVYSVVHK